MRRPFTTLAFGCKFGLLFRVALGHAAWAYNPGLMAWALSGPQIPAIILFIVGHMFLWPRVPTVDPLCPFRLTGS